MSYVGKLKAIIKKRKLLVKIYLFAVGCWKWSWGIFYAMNITKTGLPLSGESVDVISHEDFIEYLNQRGTVVFLAETLRVLKKGGVYRVNTPNVLSSMRDHSDFRKGIQGVYAYEWDRIQHLNILTPEHLKELALMLVYQEIIFKGRYESTSKLIPLEYRHDLRDRPEYDNIFEGFKNENIYSSL